MDQQSSSSHLPGAPQHQQATFPPQGNDPYGRAMPPQQKKKTSALAVTAFVLSLLFFLPLLPLIGSVLGIVAVVRLSSRKHLGGMGLGIAAIPIGFVVVFFVQGMMAAIAIPAFVKYLRKSKTIEATESLDKIRAGVRSYALADRYDEAGELLPKGAPRGDTGWTPATSCCGETPKCAPSSAAWNKQLWKQLHFGMAEPHFFVYRYQSADGKRFSIEARGDLDCDGEMSSFKLAGSVDGEGAVTFEPLRMEREIE